MILSTGAQENKKFVQAAGVDKEATIQRGVPNPYLYKPLQEVLIAFESGHYKEFKGTWLGDSVWGHHRTTDGRIIHVNKDKVEYIQTKEL